MEYKSEGQGYGHGSGQYSAVPSSSYGYHSKMKSVWRTLLYRHSYEDAALEKLYKVFVYKLQLSSLKCMVVIAIIITTLLCIFNFVFVSGITVENICYIVLCVLFISILIFLHTRYMKVTRLKVISVAVLFLYLCFAVISLPINFTNRPYKHFAPVDGLWPTLITIFIIYTLSPLRICVTFVTGFLLSVLHTLLAIFLTETYEWLLWRQITANVLLFIFVHLVGIFVFDKTEHAQRKVFSEARSCIAARIEAEDENDKLEKLLCTILPQATAKEVKRDLLAVDQTEVKDYSQTVDNVSLLYANVIGLTELSSQCTASELVNILNHVFAKFDGLAGENHCVRYRIIGDVYFCTSGLTESRPDHAKCCVDLAIDLIDILREIREGTELEIYAKIGIHSGNVACGIVGSHRWGFDVFGHDVQVAKEVMLACMPGKVLISKHTFEYLQGEYDVEPANLWNRNEYLRECKMETFYVIPGIRRRPIGIFRSNSQLVLPSQNRHSFRNMSGVIAKLMEGLVPSAETPFLLIAQGPEMDNMDKESVEPHHQSSRSVSSVMQDKVQRYLTQSVRNRSIEKSKADWVNLITLVYHHAYKEKRYNRQEDLSFSTTMLCSLMLLVIVAAVQAIVLPRTLLLLLLFLLCFTWISVVLIIFLGAKLRCIDCDFQRSLAVRLIIIITTAFLMYSVGQINVFCCKGGWFFPNGNVTTDTIIAFNRDFHLSCDVPQYVYMSAVMAIITTAIYVKLAAWVKLLITLVMAAGYVVLLEVTHTKLLRGVDIRNHPDLPHHLQGLLAVLILVIAVYVQARLMEWTLRLGFLWKDQAMDERIAVTEFQNHVRLVVMSMLPSHVATHFVDFTGLKHSLELYGHSYSRVGILCTSVPNFLDHFRGNISFGNANANNNNNEQQRGLEAFRTLHQLVSSFDQLLSEDRFGDLDKVRSFGQGYQVAVGLAQERPILETTDSVSHHLTLLVEFVFAMAERVRQFNDQSGTEFRLRAGITMGPITVGVIGARRPQFDVWGYTMYLANLMEASGKPGVIQVTEDAVPPLASRYEFQSRSPLYLNGRGELKPYFITGRKFSHMPPAQPSFSGGGNPLPKSSDNWKRLSSDAPFSGINKPHDPSVLGLKTGSAERPPGGMGSRVSTGERSFESLQTLQGGNPLERKGSYVAESPLSQRSFQFNNAVQRQNSNESGYGMRIAALSRQRVPSDDVMQTATKATMTPPSSLSRKRRDSMGNLHGSLTKAQSAGSGSTLAPPSESLQNRVASPDLPLVHYQRQGSGGNLQGETTSSFTRNILTQSQILNPDRDGRSSSSNNSNKSQNITPSHSGANLQSTNLNAVQRRSSTQTPSSNRSSSETVGSVLSIQMESPNQSLIVANEQPTYNTPPRTKPVVASHVNNSYAVNLPKIEESNRENKSFSSKDSLDDLEDSSHQTKISLGDHYYDATGNEIAEMDQILRELGCTSAAQLANRKLEQLQAQNPNSRSNIINDLNLSSPKGVNVPKQTSLSSVKNIHESVSDESHTKTMSSDHGTQISEYENDDSLRIPAKTSDIKHASKVSLLHKRNSLPDNHHQVTRDLSGGVRESLPKDQSSCSHSISTQTNILAAKPSRIPTKPVKRDHVYRPLYSKHVGTINDDSSSTSSSIYGVPKMRKVKVEKPEPDDDDDDDDQEDSPPPLPPPPCESAMVGLDKRLARSQHPYQYIGGHGQQQRPQIPRHNQQQQIPRYNSPGQHRQVLYNNSAFRPVAPNRMRGGGGGGGGYSSNFLPVMRGPNMGFIGRSHRQLRPPGVKVNPSVIARHHSKQHDVLSSNTSEENAAQVLPRRKPKGIATPKVVVHKEDQRESEKQKSKIPKLMFSKSADDRNKMAAKPTVPAVEQMKKKERHHSEGEILEDSTDDTLNGEAAASASKSDSKAAKPRVAAPPFQVKRRQHHKQPIRKCRSLDYIPSDLEDVMSVSSRADSPACEYSTEKHDSYMPITELIKSHIIGDNISLSSLESGSEMSRSEPDLNYDSSTTAYESEYDNYRPGMASDEDYFVPEPISDVELGMFDDINLEDVTISDQYNIDMADFLNKNRKVITDV